MPEKSTSDEPAKTGLTPPGYVAATEAASSRPGPGLWIALAAVLVIGLAVIMVLPTLVSTRQPDSEITAPVLPAGADARTAANDAMQVYLQLRAQLQLVNAPVWGEPQWSQSDASADQGSRQLAQRQFGVAAGHYQAALQSLQQLDGERDQRLSQALQQADVALQENQISRAIEHYEFALAMDAGLEAARLGLARANNRRAVLDNIATAEQAEARGDLPAAQVAYQKAATLDAAYTPAAQALQRITAKLGSLAFRDAMSRALSALDGGRLFEARQALEEAGELRPGDTAVRDAQARLSQLRLRGRLNTYRREAANLVKTEDWQAAITVYKKVLAVDANAGFARAGLDKAEARLTLHRQFDHYLNQPDRLYAAQPLDNAVSLLASAGSSPAAEPILARKITELQRLVNAAQTPVRVNILSDGETNISIYHVGQLGAFTRHQLDLLPGTYTVVGKRVGYRTVYKEMQVIPGKQDTMLEIRCEELI